MLCHFNGAKGPEVFHSITAIANEPELDQIYRMLCRCIASDGETSSPRGMESKEITDLSFFLSNPRNRVISSAHRNVKPRYLAGEFLWYLLGDRHISAIIRYSKFWKKLVDEKGMVNSNYGNKMIYNPYGMSGVLDEYSQFIKTAELLKSDPDSRRAIVNIHMGTPENLKDVPCTLTLQFFIRDRKLNLSVNMRSNDLILGFCNDVFQFTMFQELMLRILQIDPNFSDLELGYYHHHAGSLHVYQNNYDKLEAEISDDFTPDPDLLKISTMPEMPRFRSLTQLRNWINYLVNRENADQAEYVPRMIVVTDILDCLEPSQQEYADTLFSWINGESNED